MLTKEQKKNYITEISAQFENSKAVMVTHYQGLTMTQLDELRAKMREHGPNSYHATLVQRNSTTKRNKYGSRISYS
jgi:ribosomal protein L10